MILLCEQIDVHDCELWQFRAKWRFRYRSIIISLSNSFSFRKGFKILLTFCCFALTIRETLSSLIGVVKSFWLLHLFPSPLSLFISRDRISLEEHLRYRLLRYIRHVLTAGSKRLPHLSHVTQISQENRSTSCMLLDGTRLKSASEFLVARCPTVLFLSNSIFTL